MEVQKMKKSGVSCFVSNFGKKTTKNQLLKQSIFENLRFSSICIKNTKNK